MSTVNTLTAEQTAAHNKAADMYAIKMTNANGGIKNKPVIIMPTFEMDANGNWFPVETNGMRVTKKDGFSFLRVAMVKVALSTAGTPEVKVIKSNVFNEDTKLEALLSLYGIGIGDAIPDMILVTEESLLPFNKKNPERDYKFATGNLQCTFTGEHNGIEYDVPAPIYRRVKLAPASTGKDVLIAHTNGEEISKFASAEWAKLNAPQAAISGAATLAGKAKAKK
jgi:hypothetical protein